MSGCRSRKTVKLIHEGRYAAEVPVELIEDDTGWSPYLSLKDVKKLDTVRLALRKGDNNACGPEALDDLLRARAKYVGQARLFVLTNAGRFSRSTLVRDK